MNRPIKFRAWDAHNKVMINPYCELRENRFWGEDLTNTGYADPVSVMQFTGLKDKNRVEIWEGDAILDGGGTVGVVEWNQDDCSFSVNWGTELYEGLHADESVYFEVCGNIYQNPELLK